MKSRFLICWLVAGAAMVSLVPVSVTAAEMRTWTSIDGKVLQGTFDKIDFSGVSIKTSDGRTVVVPKARLSQGDLQYLKDIGVENAPKGLGDDPSKKPAKLVVPAKEAKVDTKAFVKKGKIFEFQDINFDTLETPHFLVNVSGKDVDSGDAAENAERLWHEMAFYHPGFAAKWGEKKMALFFVSKPAEWDYLGKWYADMVRPVNPQGADEMLKTWPRAGGGALQLDEQTAERYNAQNMAPAFKVLDPKMQKGVWSPFRTHVLSGDLLSFLAGGTSGFASKGRFAIFTGFSYYKEIALCGESQTSMISAAYIQGGEVKSTGGFNSSKSWASELKGVLKKSEYIKPPVSKNGKPTKVPVTDLVALSRVFTLEESICTPVDVALIYGLSAFMQSTQERLEMYAKLIDTIEKSKQIPSEDDISKLYGFENAAAFQTAWLEWMKSGAFK